MILLKSKKKKKLEMVELVVCHGAREWNIVHMKYMDPQISLASYCGIFSKNLEKSYSHDLARIMQGNTRFVLDYCEKR